MKQLMLTLYKEVSLLIIPKVKARHLKNYTLKTILRNNAMSRKSLFQETVLPTLQTDAECLSDEFAVTFEEK